MPPMTIAVKHNNPIPWKKFDDQKIHEALIWTRGGGVALIVPTERSGISNKFAYIIGPDRRVLRIAGKRLGLDSRDMSSCRIHALDHYAVSGDRLRRAEDLCRKESVTSPARDP